MHRRRTRLRAARATAQSTDRQAGYGLPGQQAQRRDRRVARRVVDAHAGSGNRPVRTQGRIVARQRVLLDRCRRRLRIATRTARHERRIAERQLPIVLGVVIVVVVILPGIRDSHARCLLSGGSPPVGIVALRHLDIANGRDAAPVVLQVGDRRCIDTAARHDLRSRADAGHGRRGRAIRVVGRVLIRAVPLTAVGRIGIHAADARRVLNTDLPRLALDRYAERRQRRGIDRARRSRHHATRVRDLVGMQFHVAAGLDQRRRVVDQGRVRVLAAGVLATGQYNLAHPEDGRRRHRISRRRAVAVLDVVRENFKRAVAVRRANQRGRTDVRYRARCVERHAAAHDRTRVGQIARLRMQQPTG
ncbi:Uncharacterised protein [Burkholderia pseudomallei]|nr:Uncharacterised protein [Burkholderia pseudomallei]